MHPASQGELTPAAFREIVQGFQVSRVLLTAYELDLFSIVGDAARTSAEVAAALSCDPRATDRLMNALAALGFLVKEGGRFSNTGFTGRHLVRGRPEFMSGLMHSVGQWVRWSTLTEAVRKGTAVRGRETGPGADAWREAFMAAMHWRGVQQAADIAALVDLRGARRLVDVAGGTGVFAVAFVRANPDLRAVVFDLPEIVPITTRYIADAGLSTRVTAVAGNLVADEIGRDFDVAFLSAILHSFPPEENRRIIEKAVRAVVPGGRVVVQEFLVDGDRRGPVQPALFALNMLVSTEAGDTYTESEIRSWMAEAGLADVTRTDTRFGSSLIEGRKA
jgi:ubiquinone/menaquinone biosynthesis C-methylase UbiE